jgi:hypothetical protein
LTLYAVNREIAGSIPDEVIGFFFFSLPNPSSRSLALVSTQSLAEMSIRISLGAKGWPVRDAGRLTAICESIV